MKFTKLSILSASLALGIASTAMAESGHQLVINLEIEGGDSVLPCEVISAPNFSFGDVDVTGVHVSHSNFTFSCDNPDVQWDAFFDEYATAADNGAVYSSDEFSIYIGTLSSESTNGTVFYRGVPSEAGCVRGDSGQEHTRPVRVGSYNIFPVGGLTSTSPSTNKNACLTRQGNADTNVFNVEMTALLAVGYTPDSGWPDDIPEMLSLPLTIVPTQK